LTAFYDALESRDPADRERILFERLPAQVALARDATPYYGQLLAGIEPAQVTSRAALARLPLTRKSDLHALQKARMPFGGLNATTPSHLARIFMSPGPIYDPEGRRADYWRAARALYAAGFRSGDVALNCFSYHLSPAGSMFETGLHHLDCAVIPGAWARPSSRRSRSPTSSRAATSARRRSSRSCWRSATSSSSRRARSSGRSCPARHSCRRCATS
jgi:phenylacetate-CoA ligase